MLKQLCSVLDCNNPVRARELCGRHYATWRRNGDPTKRVYQPTGPGTECSVDSCDRDVAANGLCVKHRSRYYRHGDPLTVLKGPEVPAPTAKQCRMCEQIKPMEEFSRGGKGCKGGRSSYCLPCAGKRQREWRAANPELNRATTERFNQRRQPSRAIDRLAWSYKLTGDQFNEILKGQGGGCAICAGVPNGRGTRFHVDHDHRCCPQAGRCCGKCIRGLLCSKCNTMLGLAGENSGHLLAAARYLQQSQVRMAAMAALRVETPRIDRRKTRSD